MTTHLNPLPSGWHSKMVRANSLACTLRLCCLKAYSFSSTASLVSRSIRMAIARALCSHNQELFQPLRDDGFLTRDSRMKERKKYGLHGARRGTQFSKR